MECKSCRDLHILHIDMDAFYASVEEQDNPKLMGKPVIVGGRSKHGIVTTANYQARKFGIHSAMPIFMARKRCPHGFYITPRIKRYQEESQKIYGILCQITNLVEQVSIDEAYLDIESLNEDPVKVAKDIQSQVLDKTGLTMSIGISYNKFLAKLASDWNKPNGIKLISRDMIPEILLPLPIKSVYGIGPKSKKRLNDIGIYNIEDLMELSEEFLIELFGKAGREVYYRIRGIDDREIEIERERKSMGTETTFSEDIKDKEELEKYLYSFSQEISKGLKDKGLYARTITLKVKYENFKVITRSRTLEEQTDEQTLIFQMGKILLDDIKLKQKLRLIGLSVSNLSDLEIRQLSIFDC